MREAQLFLGLVWVLFAWCFFVLGYRYGGWKNHRVRRWAVGTLLPLNLILCALWLHTFNWWMLASFALWPLWLSCGYGGDTLDTKLRRRLIFALAASVAVAPFLLPVGLYGLWLFQSLLAITASVYLGLRNPLSATAEESLIGGLSTLIAALSVLR